ncbi:phage head closure protein [Ahrensia marina]|uniref:Head-tail adaptor protein n=1 Tax=Ahrensia marina TaxID=1514904 RepID=A0A0M9GKP0_9HYPH|nr:phage head closure protein [Ahrensia marina]KPA99972.1 head-tail adaptor protein [Ahrensia marina]
MRAGKLDKEITLQRSSNTVDDAGSPTITWTPYDEVRAEIVQQSTQEFIENQGATEETIVIFRIRFVEGVLNRDSVLYNGKIHNIREVTEIGRKRGLEIRTVTVTGAAN